MPRHAPRGAIKGKSNPLDGSDLMETRSRCSATSKRSGKQCGRAPIPGGTVCVMHGGGAPQVRLKAKERLMALQVPAIATLSFLMKQRATYPSTALGAAKDVLDRTEGKPKESIDMNVTGEIALVPERLQAARKRLAER